MAETTEILVVDDHPVIGTAMRILLTDNLPNVKVFKADGGKASLKMLKEKSYDLVILDVNLPDYNVLNLIPNMFALHADLKILIFTMSPENILARRLFSMDVSGFLSKSVEDEEILKAVQTILKGRKYISPDFSDQVIGDFLSGKKNVNPFEDLSDREYQILMELLKGSSSKDIGEMLHLHSSSVATYRIRLFNKLGVENQMELYKKAKAFGVVEQD